MGVGDGWMITLDSLTDETWKQEEQWNPSTDTDTRGGGGGGNGGKESVHMGLNLDKNVWDKVSSPQ